MITENYLTVLINNQRDTCISNIDNTPATKKRQAITGVRQKASTDHSSITTTSRPQNLEDRPDHHEDILTFL
jgi:hypothetical protein